MENQITIIDPKEFGIEERKANDIEKSFLPKQIESIAFAEQYAIVVNKELNKETFKEARELRLKLVKVRTGISDVHKTEKAFFLASGKYVDALKNKLTFPIEQMESKLLEIEQYEAKIEAERKSNLKTERILLLNPFGTDVQFIALDEMNEEQFSLLFEREKSANEARIENARIAEEKRIADEKAEIERVEAEKLAEAKRIEEQRLENDRLKKEAEKEAKIQAKKDAEVKAENERLASIAKAEKEKADILAKQIQDAKDAKLKEQKDLEDKANALKNADDKTQVKAFYESFKQIKFPELKSIEGQKMAILINKEIENLRKLVIKESNSLI